MIYLIGDPQGRTDSAANMPHGYPDICCTGVRPHAPTHLAPCTEMPYGYAATCTGVRPDAPYEASPIPSHGPDMPPFYPLRLLALGHPYAVDHCCKHLHKLRYAEYNDWSIPLPIIHATTVIRTANPGDVMRILTKRISPPV